MYCRHTVVWASVKTVFCLSSTRRHVPWGSLTDLMRFIYVRSLNVNFVTSLVLNCDSTSVYYYYCCCCCWCDDDDDDVSRLLLVFITCSCVLLRDLFSHQWDHNRDSHWKCSWWWRSQLCVVSWRSYKVFLCVIVYVPPTCRTRVTNFDWHSGISNIFGTDWLASRMLANVLVWTFNSRAQPCLYSATMESAVMIYTAMKFVFVVDSVTDL